MKRKPWVSYYRFFYSRKPKVFSPLYWSGQSCEQVCRDFGSENDFPYWKPFLLAGTKREPIKQSLWEKTMTYQNEIKQAPKSI